jgi:hypothetical protein
MLRMGLTDKSEVKAQDAWLQWFLPRAEKSIWSKVNRDKTIVLMASGRRQPAGAKAVGTAKIVGRSPAAYDS